MNSAPKATSLAASKAMRAASRHSSPVACPGKKQNRSEPDRLHGSISQTRLARLNRGTLPDASAIPFRRDAL